MRSAGRGTGSDVAGSIGTKLGVLADLANSKYFADDARRRAVVVSG